jgi:ABC-type transporter Mla subunit MlaD
MNLQQKKAFLSVLTSIAFFMGLFAYVAYKQAWFEPRVSYKTKISYAEGLREGTEVSLAGLKIGEVSEINVNQRNQVIVYFDILKSYEARITEGSRIQVSRDMIIGEKKLNLLPGPPTAQRLPEESILKGRDSYELPDLLAGRNLEKIWKRIDKLSSGAESLSSAFVKLAEEVKDDDLVQFYKQVLPLMKETRSLMREVRGLSQDFQENKKPLFDLIRNTNELMGSTQADLRLVRKELLDSGVLIQLTKRLNRLSGEMSKSPELWKELLVALEESVVTMKAMQKTWFLSDHAEEVREKMKELERSIAVDPKN